MSVVVIGLNHRTAPLDLLERMTVDAASLPKALHDLTGREQVTEAVVLSTCNRTEVYADVERFHAGYQDVREFLSGIGHLPPEAFADHLYAHHEADAVCHLFSVASGLDSVVLGESEILGQVKGAWAAARNERAAGASLNLAFRHGIEVGKRTRTETGIARHVTSISTAAVAMAHERLDGLDGRRVLVLGAGDMGKGMLGALSDSGVAEVMIANRTWARATEISERIGATPVALADLPQALTEVDLLLTSTGARSLMVDHADLEPALSERPTERPLLIVDIAVPRDVDPAVADLSGVTLLDMDDLRAFTEIGLEGRRRELGAARSIVDDEVERFTAASTAREVAPLVSALRERADEVIAAELERHQGRFTDLDETQQQVAEEVARAALAKVLHEPTVRLKDASGTGRGDRLAEAVRELFDL